MKNIKKIYTIVLIGSGNIGSRHLQGLAKLNLCINLIIIDKSDTSLDLAKSRLAEKTKINNIQSIKYLNNIEEFNTKVDLGIIATNANIRKGIIKKLIKLNKISKLLIEKVCFQSNSDYLEIINFLKLKRVKTWVNLTKRNQPIYKLIKEKVKKSKKIYIEISSGSFEIGSNAIHALDILSFLSQSKIKSIDMSLIDKKIFKSKRSGFIDFNGSLKANTFRGDELILTNIYNSEKPEITSIYTKNYFFIINDLDKTISTYKKKVKKNNHFILMSIKNYKESYQSNMTHKDVNDILLTNKSQLPTLIESYDIHQPMLKAFINHINSIEIKKLNICKIT